MDGDPFNKPYQYYDESNHQYVNEQLEYQKEESRNGFCFLLFLIVIITFMSYIIPLIPCCNNNDNNNNHLEPLLLKKETITLNQNETCTICLELLKKNDIISTLNCNHRYHHVCIKKWTEKERTCPLCRVTLL